MVDVLGAEADPYDLQVLGFAVVGKVRLMQVTRIWEDEQGNLITVSSSHKDFMGGDNDDD